MEFLLDENLLVWNEPRGKGKGCIQIYFIGIGMYMDGMEYVAFFAYVFQFGLHDYVSTSTQNCHHEVGCSRYALNRANWI